MSVLSVYSLGIFSGIASSCCAPVLAGVIALASVAASFWLALGLGTAYVFGMVAPLFLIALLWDRYDWRASRLFRPRSWTWRLGGLQRTVTMTNLATGILLTIKGEALAVRNGMLFPPGLFLDDEAFSYGRLSERKLRREIEQRLGTQQKGAHQSE